jgi:hypothetical protein
MALRRKQALEQADEGSDQQPSRPARTTRKAARAGETARGGRDQRSKIDIDAYIMNKAGATPATAGRRRPVHERKAS